jgi:hypothetical protein
MAKAKKQTAAQVAAQAAKLLREQDQSTELELGGETEDAEDDVISELRSLGAGESYRYVVSRVSTKPGEKAGYCATYNSGDLSLDSIREQFGGGKYRIRVVDESGKYAGNRTVEIVDLPKPTATANTQSAPAALDLQGIAALLAATKSNAPASDGGMATVLAAMIQSQGEMIRAMTQQQKGPSITEIIAAINASKTGGGNEKGAVEMLLQGLELGRSLQGGETGMLDVAKEGLSMIAPLLAQQREQQQQVPRLPAPARPGVAPAAPATPAAATGGEDMGLIQKLNWLRQQTNALVHQAQRDKDPELYAEVMLDNLPPFIDPAELLTRLQQPGAVAELAQLNGAVAQYAEWFEEFRAAAVAILTAPPEGEPEAGAGDLPTPPAVN